MAKNKVYMVEVGAYKDEDGKLRHVATFCRERTHEVHENPTPESMARIETWAWKAVNEGDVVIEPYFDPNYTGFVVHVTGSKFVAVS